MLITSTNPAQPSEYISLFLTGLGTVTPTITDGALGPTNPLSYVGPLQRRQSRRLLQRLRANGSAGNPGNIQFAGLAPGLAGLYQINVQVPTAVWPRETTSISSLSPMPPT